MATIFLFHGAYGHPKENWFPWMKKQLERNGHKVIAPRFPTPKRQTLENWRKVFSKYARKVDENTVFIGHSIGCAFLLRLIENSTKTIKAAYCVAGFTGPLGNPKFDTVNRTFTQRKFRWGNIREHCRKFVVFCSDNDPYVPMEKGKMLAKRLKTKPILVRKAGHFNKAAGYQAFPLLLKSIEKASVYSKSQ
jgi:predicted alpha/beta hydrolase family esterase